MKTRILKPLLLLVVVLLLPLLSHAQLIGNEVYKLNDVLERLFEEMIPLCRPMMDVGRAIAGFAALWYIAMRVWKHIARAESIDFYPLMRPFAIGMAILLFPSVIALVNGVLKPTVVATKAMSENSHQAILYHIAQEEKANRQPPPVGGFPGSTPETDKYLQPDKSGNPNDALSGLANAFSFFNMKSMFKVFISEIVQTLYAAASLCINTIRTFYLVILAILGPLVFGLSVFDGFSHSLASWFARYINTYMWLPVANIFGAISSKILENMMNLDQGFFSSTAYIIFMLISIVGYFTVPNVAGYIIEAGGRDTLLHKVTDMSKQAGMAAGKAVAGML